MKRLPVDLPELASLFDQSRAGPVRSFLDRVTGELESMPRDAEVEGVYDDIVTAPERWAEIRPLPAVERIGLRRRFVDEQIGDPHLRLRLFEALDGDGSGARGAVRAFTRFDAILREHPGELDRWLAFRALALAPLARAWLSALDITCAGPSQRPALT